MARRKPKDENVLKLAHEKMFSSKVTMAGTPREKIENPLETAKAYKKDMEECRLILKEDPYNHDALVTLKKLLFSYKAFHARQKKRIKNKSVANKELAALFNSIPSENLRKLITKTELAQYNKYFEDYENISKPRVATLMKAKGVSKRMRTETILDIYRTLYFDDSIRLKIEQGLLENPKELYPAARALKRRFIIHTGTTNTGKTYNAIKALKKAETGAYLGPLRLLALEIQDDLLMSDVMCNLKTGEEENIVRYATHVASTVEMADVYSLYDVVVIDECQMIGDKYRGCAWTRAILGMRASEIHLCTAPDAVDILTKIIDDCGDEYEIVNYKRRTPLLYDKSLDTNAHINWTNEEGNLKKPSCRERLEKINLDKLEYGDALIAFSRSDVLEISEALKERGIEASVIYGALPYEARRNQLERFIKGETKIVVATDAIGMGLNLPIKRVIFTSVYKYDGRDYRLLYPSEIKQIAGRAGRIGIYDEGFVYSVGMSEYVKGAINAEITPIEEAYIDFDTAFVEIEYNLEGILKAWQEAQLPFDMYKKINVDRTIKLLHSIDKLCEEKDLTCDKETAYRLANVVFDEKEIKLHWKWLDYVESYLRGDTVLQQPRIRKSSLENLEVSFKKLDLYYAFCNTMGYEPDNEWLELKKSQISKEINVKLGKK